MRALNAQVEELLHDNAPDMEIAKAIKGYLKAYFATLPETFAETGGKDFLLRHTRTIDTVIRLAYKVAARGMFGPYTPLKNQIPVTLVALGSYGREQLCLHSDIDLMFVYEDIEGYATQALIEKMLYLLWDSGLKLGHRVHELRDLPVVAKEDITIKSALLESRFIEGSKFLWTGIENALNEIRREEPEAFIRLKVEERRALHQRYPLTMEPHLKEGVGGFRDANMVFWMGKLLHNVPRIRDLDATIVDPEDYRKFRIALEFLFRVRTALHIVAGKKVDQVRLDLLPELGKLLKYGNHRQGQLRLARRIIGALRTVHLYSRIWLERLIGDYLPELYTECYLPEKRHRKLHALVEELNRQAEGPFRIHPELLHALIHAERPERPDRTLYLALRHTFERPAATSVLQAFVEARLLGYMVPAMKKVIDLPQFDGYHRYPVDRHSIECLRHLENIEDPFIAELFDNLEPNEKTMLKVALLLHDAGKGRKKDHHLVGASLFRIFARKLGIGEELIEIGARLILYHTLMSVTAQREDIYSEKVVLRFVSRFGSKKLLDMIYILTYADMKGVGTGVYSSHSSRLLRILYEQSLEALNHPEQLSETAKRVRAVDRLKNSKAFRELPRTLQNNILSISSNAFFIRHSTRRIIAIAKAAAKMEEYTYHLSNEHNLTVEIIRRHDLNLAWFLHRLARLQVVSMEIAKLWGDLKYFRIDFNDRLDESELPRLDEIIHGSFAPHPEMKLRKPLVKAEEVTCECNHSREYAMMKLRAADQPGLLAYLIALFDRLGVDIASAKIHTIKGRVNDLFLIEKNGNFCHNIDKIIQELTE
jgi:[protein-PII] uridylyltransferase